MDNFLNKAKEDLKKVILSPEEKQAMLLRILNKPTPSPYYYHSRFYATLCSIILSVGIVTYASEKALPGEVLYQVKTQVTEPLRDTIQVSPQSKVDWEEEKAIRRIEEVADLSSQNALTEKKIKTAEKNFGNHAEAFTSAVGKLATSSDEKKNIKEKFKQKIERESKKIKGDKETYSRKFIEKVKKDIEKIESDVSRRHIKD